MIISESETISGLKPVLQKSLVASKQTNTKRQADKEPTSPMIIQKCETEEINNSEITNSATSNSKTGNQ